MLVVTPNVLLNVDEDTASELTAMIPPGAGPPQ
jgi:hypothetical protein